MYIKTIIDNYGAQLTIDERNLLSMAYKNITNNLRSSWRVIDNLLKVQLPRTDKPGRSSAGHLSLLRGQRQKIEQELTDVCKDIVALVDRQLQPAAKSGEESVFYSKM
jgi:14-3-3 protein epsilon